MELVENVNYSYLKGAISYSLFGPSNSSTPWLQWNKILYHESLLDAGIYTPADFSCRL